MNKLQLLFIFFIINGIFAVEVILDRNFQKKQFCLEGIESNVTFINGSPYNMNCEQTCHMNEYDNNDKLSLLDIIGGLGAVFTFPLASYTEPYSYIQVDVSYINPSDSKKLSIDINGLVSGQFVTVSTKSMYEDPPQIVCSRTKTTIYTTSLTLEQQLPTGTDLIVKFNELNSNLVYLRSIQITKNCTPNCSKCLNNQSCSTCLSGYSKYEFPSGPTVCEQVGVCTTANCFSCAKYGSQEVCLKCNQGFALNSSKTCDANTPIPSTTCKSNEYSENGFCVQYSSVGYFENRQTGELIKIKSSQTDVQTTYKCPKDTLAIVLKDNNYQTFQCRCMFDNCIGCSVKETCTYCTPGMKFDATTNSCVKLPYTDNTFKLVQKVTETGYTFSFVFENELVTTDLEDKNLKIQITNFQNFTYKYKGQKDKNTIIVDIICNGDVKNEDVSITISDTTFLKQNLIKQTSLEQPLDPFVQVSASDRQAAQNLNSAGTAVSKTVVGSLIPIAFLGNFYVLINTIDLTAFLYYLLFINVRFPINIFQFYDIFKNFQMAFIPNFFAELVGAGYTQQAPPQFMQQQTDSYFLNNSGQSISVYLIIMGIYVVAKIFSGIDIKYVQSYCKRACNETWEFGGIFDAIWTVYIYILIGVLLQFYIYDCGDSSCGFNYFFFSLWALVCFVIPFLVFYLIYNNPNIKDDKYTRVKYSSLISGLKLFSSKDSLLKDKDEEQNTPPQTNNLFPSVGMTQSQSQIHPQELGWRQQLVVKLSKYNMAILYFRKILFSLIIVYMYEYSYAQLALISFMNIIVAAYYLVIQPFESKYENFKNAASEILLISIQIIIGLLVEDSKSEAESDRIRLGWIAIGLIAFVIGWHAIGILVDFFIGIYQYIKQLKDRRNRVKVANFDQQEENNQDASPSSQAKKRLANRQKITSLAVEELPAEDEDDETNFSPLQSQRLKRNKMSQVSQLRREGSINNLETFVDQTNVSPEQSPKRKRVSRLSLTNANSQPQQQLIAQQPENGQESIYDIPHSNNQMMQQEEQQRFSNNKRFTKIRNILES